ncbi:MAG: hypothetical protein H6825_15230 [Planctomycetes bacterium]|nr:hypothetical protein [Planctomycetota bacterium]
MSVRRQASIAVLLAVGTCGAGCIQVVQSYSRPVADDATLARLRPGESRRGEVLALLGPPDEYVMPRPTERTRSADPAALRITEEHDVISRRAFTFSHERRRDDVFAIVPFFTLFSWWKTTHLVDRVLVTFDERGFVEHVAVRRETGS